VRMTGVEAGGRGIRRGEHAARFAAASSGSSRGARPSFSRDPDGQIEATHSVSAGLDYAASGPSTPITATSAASSTRTRPMTRCSRRSSSAPARGIIPALESTHAIVHALKRARALPADKVIIVNLSGRGDKDVQEVAKLIGGKP